ncbi:E3 ubiquitin-protein ligase [Hordeum vulgare]|nr:E3 ubiquitin-protein ligase [Hordeum vulgare]
MVEGDAEYLFRVELLQGRFHTLCSSIHHHTHHRISEGRRRRRGGREEEEGEGREGAGSVPRHVVEEHERSCRYEPCFFPACQRPFFPGVDDSAQERHLAGRHDWLLHRLTYGKDVLVDVDPDRLALIRAHDRLPRLVPLLLLLWVLSS